MELPLEKARVTEKVVRQEHGALDTVENPAWVSAGETAGGTAQGEGKKCWLVDRDFRVSREVDSPQIHHIQQDRGRPLSVDGCYRVVKRLRVEEEAATGCDVDEVVGSVELSR
jgi:hypothetical protein